tara:strand:- start:76474 stop:76866 length:393 start_codon:yes stop_codon:yes gene_type:complete
MDINDNIFNLMMEKFNMDSVVLTPHFHIIYNSHKDSYVYCVNNPNGYDFTEGKMYSFGQISEEYKVYILSRWNSTNELIIRKEINYDDLVRNFMFIGNLRPDHKEDIKNKIEEISKEIKRNITINNIIYE